MEAPQTLADFMDQFGQCCACGEIGPTVRNLITLPLRAPDAPDGTRQGGWGCYICKLPQEGAIAVTCDRCIHEHRPIREVCAGYPGLGHRVPIDQVTEPFDHDPAFHPELQEPRGNPISGSASEDTLTPEREAELAAEFLAERESLPEIGLTEFAAHFGLNAEAMEADLVRAELEDEDDTPVPIILFTIDDETGQCVSAEELTPEQEQELGIFRGGPVAALFDLPGEGIPGHGDS